MITQGKNISHLKITEHITIENKIVFTNLPAAIYTCAPLVLIHLRRLAIFLNFLFLCCL